MGGEEGVLVGKDNSFSTESNYLTNGPKEGRGGGGNSGRWAHGGVLVETGSQPAQKKGGRSVMREPRNTG